MKTLLVLLTGVLFLLPLPVSAAMCPVSFPECYPMDLEEELRSAHLLDASVSPIRDWELEAIHIICSGSSHRRTLVDIFDLGVYGFAHFDSPDALSSLPLCEDASDLSCPHFIQDPVWRSKVEELLYSPYSAGIQLRAWRRITGPGVRAARRNGLDQEEGLILAACLSNSLGGHGFSSLGESVDWNLKAILLEYYRRSPTLHRTHRIRQLNRLIEES